jgi:hypothetical protein
MATRRFFDGAASELGLLPAEQLDKIITANLQNSTEQLFDASLSPSNIIDSNFIALSNFFYNPTWRRSNTITPKFEDFKGQFFAANLKPDNDLQSELLSNNVIYLAADLSFENLIISARLISGVQLFAATLQPGAVTISAAFFYN